MKPLTLRQYATLLFINDYRVTNGRPPMVKEIALYFGITQSAMSGRLRRLAKLGYLYYKSRFPVRVLFMPGMVDIARAA